MFAELARYIFSQNGVVFGCTMQRVEEGFEVKHIYIEKEEDLFKLQGSKYVQSSLGNTIKQAKEFLDNTQICRQKIIPPIEYFRDSEFNLENAKSVLEEHFKIKSFVSFGFNETDFCFNSSGALISYLIETQKKL